MPSSRHEEIKVRLVETDSRDEVAIVSAVNQKPLNVN
jgi:pyrimidine operon attenuation protein/uracil phosphoribosyltransferase